MSRQNSTQVARVLAVAALCATPALVRADSTHTSNITHPMSGAPIGLPGISSTEGPGAGPAALQRGAHVDRLEVELPPTVGALQPNLALESDHQAGDGILGLGWRLAGLSSITRTSETRGVPERGEPHRFLLEGSELIEVGSQATLYADVTVYKLENDDNRWLYHYAPKAMALSTTRDLWVVYRDGWQWVYGEDAGFGAEATEYQHETLYDACGTTTPPPLLFRLPTRWHLSRVQDPAGNAMEVDYRVPCACPMFPPAPTIDGAAACAHVPDTISYGSGRVEVELEYEDRSNALIAADSGRLRILDKRLAAIQVWNDDGAGALADTRLELTYLGDADATACFDGATPPTPDTNLTVLQRIERVSPETPVVIGGPSYDNIRKTLRCLETNHDATTFGADGLLMRGEDISSQLALPALASDADAFVLPMAVGFDGDAWPDLALLVTKCSHVNSCDPPEHKAWRNDEDPSSVSFSEDALLTSMLGTAISEGFLESQGGFLFGDVDGDGQTELLTSWSAAGCADLGLSLCGESWEIDYDGGGWSVNHGDVTLDARHLRRGVLADVNGDGLQDLVIPPYTTEMATHDELEEDESFEDIYAGATPYTLWIPNSGAAPYLDGRNIRALEIPFEDASTSQWAELQSLAGDCQNDDPSYNTFVEPRHLGLQSEYADLNSDGIADLAVSALPCWDGEDAIEDYVYSRVFLGDGRGAFHDSSWEAGPPFYARAPERTFHFPLSNRWDHIHAFAATDFDADGHVELVHPHFTADSSDGSPIPGTSRYQCDDWRSASSTCGTRLWAAPFLGVDAGFGIALNADLDGTGDATSAETGLPNPVRALRAPREMPALREATLIADFDADGFADLLRFDGEEIRGEEWEEENGGGPVPLIWRTTEVTLYRNDREVARGRVEKRYNPFGGATELSYASSAHTGESPDLHAVISVIASVSRAGGTTDYSFDDGFYDDRRFAGFGHATSNGPQGRSDHYHYAQSPAFRGQTIYHSVRNAWGALERFTYFSPMRWLGFAYAFDNTAPYFNPTRRRCDFWLEPGSKTAGMPPVLSENEDSLTEACESWLRNQGGSDSGRFAAFGWLRHVDEDPALSALTAQVWSHQAMQPRVAEPAPPGPPPPPGEAPALISLVGTAPDSFIDLGLLMSPIIEPALQLNASYASLGLFWAPGFLFSASASFPDLEGPVTSGAIEPAKPSRSYPDNTPTGGYRMYVQDYSYNADQRLAGTYDHVQTDIAEDDIDQDHSYDSWDSNAAGSALLEVETRDYTGALLERLVRDDFDPSVFDLARRHTREGAAGGSQVTTFTFDRGMLESVTNPELETTSVVRNDCGLVASHTDAVGRVTSYGYDAHCRLTSMGRYGASMNVSRDDLGRVSALSLDSGAGAPAQSWVAYYDDGIDTPDVRSSFAEARHARLHSDGSLELSYLDPWGRPARITACSVDAAALADPDPDSATDITTLAPCDAGSRVFHRERRWAVDGTARFVSRNFESGDVVAGTWRYADEFDRPQVEEAPAPVDLSGMAPGYARWRRQFVPGQTRITDPLGVACDQDFTSLDLSLACDGSARGSERAHALGHLVEETDALGVRTVHGYDQFFRRTSRYVDTSQSDCDGVGGPAITSFDYDAVGRLTREVDPYGNELRLSFDAAGRLLSRTIYDIDRAVTTTLETRSYVDADAPGRRMQVTDLNGNLTEYAIDGLDREYGVDYPDGTSGSRSFDERGRVSTFTDEDGRSFTFAYALPSRLASVLQSGAAAAMTFDYDGAGDRISTIDPDGVETTFGYTWDGRPAWTERGSWRIRERGYRIDGSVEWQFEGGVRSRFEYDGLGRVTSRCDGADAGTCVIERTMTWTDRDELESLAYGTHPATSWTYDDLGQVDTLTHPDGVIETHSYDHRGRLCAHEDGEGLMSYFDYDALDRPTSEERPGRNPRTLSYQQGVSATAVGLSGGHTQIDVDEPDGHRWTALVDFRDRRVHVDRPDGSQRVSMYVGGQLQQHQELDASGAVLARLVMGWDGLGRPAWKWGPVAESVYSDASHVAGTPIAGDYAHYYEWSDAGRPENLEGPGDIVEWVWRGDGYLDQKVLPGLYQESYSYQSSYPRLSQITREADGGGSHQRLTTLHYERGMFLRERQQHDPLGAAGTMIVDSFHNRDDYGTPQIAERQIDGLPHVRYQVATDPRGREISRDTWLDGVLLGALETRYYDNNRIQRVWADWVGGVRYDRGATSGQVDEVWITDTYGNDLALMGDVTARDGAGRLERVEQLAGTTAAFELARDSLGRITSHSIETASGATQTRSYAYDERGRRDTMSIATGGVIDDYEYDYVEPGWLSYEKRHAGTAAEFEADYDYDAAGNRTLTTHTFGGGSASLSASYGAGNRLDTIDGLPATFDDFGGMTFDPDGFEFIRGPDGALSALLDPGGATLCDITRDPYGRPLAIDEGAPHPLQQIFGNPGGNWPMAGRNTAGTPQLYIALEGFLLALKEGPSVMSAVSSPEGSVAMVGGQLLANDESAFGELEAGPVGMDMRFLYAEQQSLPGNSYRLAGHRVYDARLGRFASSDPLEHAGGMNLFAYANNDPLLYRDPQGLSAIPHVEMPQGFMCQGDCSGGPFGKTYYLGGGKKRRQERRKRRQGKRDDVYEAHEDHLFGQRDEKNRRKMKRWNRRGVSYEAKWGCRGERCGWVSVERRKPEPAADSFDDDPWDPPYLEDAVETPEPEAADPPAQVEEVETTLPEAPTQVEPVRSPPEVEPQPQPDPAPSKPAPPPVARVISSSDSPITDAPKDPSAGNTARFIVSGLTGNAGDIDFEGAAEDNVRERAESGMDMNSLDGADAADLIGDTMRDALGGERVPLSFETMEETIERFNRTIGVKKTHTIVLDNGWQVTVLLLKDGTVKRYAAPTDGRAIPIIGLGDNTPINLDEKGMKSVGRWNSPAELRGESGD